MQVLINNILLGTIWNLIIFLVLSNLIFYICRNATKILSEDTGLEPRAAQVTIKLLPPFTRT